jgi:hypothetical protein
VSTRYTLIVVSSYLQLKNSRVPWRNGWYPTAGTLRVKAGPGIFCAKKGMCLEWQGTEMPLCKNLPLRSNLSIKTNSDNNGWQLVDSNRNLWAYTHMREKNTISYSRMLINVGELMGIKNQNLATTTEVADSGRCRNRYKGWHRNLKKMGYWHHLRVSPYEK